MKLKEITPGMTIHCKNDEERMLLLEEAERIGYTWANGDNPTGYDCRGTTVHFHGNDESKYKYITQSNQTRDVTEFSDIIIPELTAEEVIEWFRDYFISDEFIELFGEDYSMSGLTSTFSPSEIVSKIAQWKSDHEDEPGKEPEIEWVYRVFGAENFGEKFFQTEEEAIKRCEELARSQKTKQYTRYERVCRVKAVE